MKTTILFGLMVLGTAPVQAQDFYGEPYQQLVRTQTVAERVHPDYAPLGIHHGSFVLEPSVEVGTAYQDNILATPNNEIDDLVTTIAPRFRVRTLPTTPHDLVIDLSARQGLYHSNSSENYTDYTARIAPTIKATEALVFNGDVGFEHLHEDRSSPNVAQTIAEPLEYDRTHAHFSGTYKPGLMRLTVGGAWDRYQFDNTAAVGGGQVIQIDRDRDEYRVHSELAYEFKPQYELFLRGSVNTIDYDRNEFVSGPDTFTGNNRDSSGFDVLTGVRFDLTSVIRADLGVGYLAQNYDQVGLPDINGVNLYADVAWNMSPLTTVNVDVERAVRETVSTGSSGYLETAIGLGVDHELRRNIILSAGTEYALQDYEGTNQKDDLFGFATRATYKMNRNVSLVLEYLYDQRDSNQLGLDFKRNIIALRAKFKL